MPRKDAYSTGRRPADEGPVVDLVPSRSGTYSKDEPGVTKVPAKLGEHGTEVKAKDLAPFTRLDGTPLPAQEAWGALPYEEIGPMFLDQFLLTYFLDLMKIPDARALAKGPWDAFVETNPWGKNLPRLFWQLTGYELTTRQKNAAIDEWIERADKLARAVRPPLQDAEIDEECR